MNKVCDTANQVKSCQPKARKTSLKTSEIAGR